MVSSGVHAVQGGNMDGRAFVTLCEECNLLDRDFRAEDADLIFKSVAPRGGQRLLSVSQFEFALKLVADLKGTSVEEVHRAIVEREERQALAIDLVQSHSDQHLSDSFNGPNRGDRSCPSTSRRVRSPNRLRSESPRGHVRSPSRTARQTARRKSPRAAQRKESVASSAFRERVETIDLSTIDEASIEEIPEEIFELVTTFRAFCSARKSMDGKRFAKLCTDCGIVDRKFTVVDADLIFVKAVPLGQRRMKFQHFWEALLLIADRKDMDICLLCSIVAETKVPRLHTKLDTVRFQVQRICGDENATPMHAEARASSSRSPSGSPSPRRSPQEAFLEDERAASPRRNASFKHIGLGSGKSTSVLDSDEFVELCANANLFDEKFTRFDAEHVYRNLVPQLDDRIGVFHLIVALDVIAKRRSMTPEQILEIVTRTTGLSDSAALMVSSLRDSATPMGSSLNSKTAGSSRCSLQSPSEESLKHIPGQAWPASPRYHATNKPATSWRFDFEDDGERRLSIDGVFKLFCGSQQLMDGHTFAKICKGCGAIDTYFNVSDAHLVFASLVLKGQRRIGVEQFELALQQVARRQGMRQEALYDAVFKFAKTMPSQSTRPRRNCSSPERSIGNPGTIDNSTDPHNAVKLSMLEQVLDGKMCAKLMKGTFENFCGGQAVMDAMAFRSFCNHCGLLDKHFTSADAELIFAKIVPKGEKHMDLVDFQYALQLVAIQKHVSTNTIYNIIARSRSPMMNAAHEAEMQAVTQVATDVRVPPLSKNLAPASLILSSNPLSLSDSLLRPVNANDTGASSQIVEQVVVDVRETLQQTLKKHASASSVLDSSLLPSQAYHESKEVGSGTIVSDKFLPDEDGSGSNHIGNGGGMGVNTFVQLCANFKLIDSQFSTADAESVFAESVRVGQEGLDFESFQKALKTVAQLKAERCQPAL